jgi:ABC-type transport system substrate-binding protein
MRRLWTVLAIALFVVAGAYSSHSVSVAASGRSQVAVARAGKAYFHAVVKTKSSRPRCKQRNTATGTAVMGAVGALDNTGLELFLTFDTLVNFNQKGRLVPRMAAVVPTIANGGIKGGGKTYTFHLRKGMRWSNGAEITSADFKFGWQIDRLAAAPQPCDPICGVDTPDRYTVTFHLKEVTPDFLDTQATNGLPDSPQPVRWPGFWDNDLHVALDKLMNDPAFSSVGPNYPTDGPYQVVRLAGTRSAVLAPMKYYNTLTCGGYIKKLTYVNYSSTAALIVAAAAGHVNILFGLGPADLPLLKQQTDAFRVTFLPEQYFEHLELNVDPRYQGQSNPLADTRVRQALALALDRSELTRRALGLSQSQARNLEAWTPWINTAQWVMPGTDRTIRGQWDPLARQYLAVTGRGRALVDAK